VTWPHAKEKDRLRVFENRLLRRIFRPMREGGTGGWKRMHNEEPMNWMLHQILLE